MKRRDGLILSPFVALFAGVALGCSASDAGSDALIVPDADTADTSTANEPDTDAPEDSVTPEDDTEAPLEDTAELDTQVPDEVETELDKAIVAQMASGNLPGVAVAVVRGDAVLFEKGYGLADVEGNVPVTVDTAFMLASVSKTVIAMAALQAADEGLVDLDEDIDGYLPFSVRAPVAPETAITLRMLLTHTSGIADDGDRIAELYVDGDSDVALGAILEDLLTPTGALYDADASFTGVAPGTAYEYSNIGASLAAFVVESATSVPFDVWCDTRIFDPLGMTHSAWHLAGLTGVPLALPYAWADGAWDTYGHYGYPDYPDGALRSSVADLGKLLRMVISGGVLGDVSVLPSWTVEAMLSDAVPEVEPGQGLIWYQYDDGGELYWGHEGGDSGVSTTMFFRPSDGLGVIVLTNMDAPEAEDAPFALYEIEALLYDAAEGW